MDHDGEISVEGFAADGMRIKIKFTHNGSLRSYERERDDRRCLTVAAARERIAMLGYTDLGFVERGGRHVKALEWRHYRLRQRLKMLEILRNFPELFDREY